MLRRRRPNLSAASVEELLAELGRRDPRELEVALHDPHLADAVAAAELEAAREEARRLREQVAGWVVFSNGSLRRERAACDENKQLYALLGEDTVRRFQQEDH